MMVNWGYLIHSWLLLYVYIVVNGIIIVRIITNDLFKVKLNHEKKHSLTNHHFHITNLILQKIR